MSCLHPCLAETLRDDFRFYMPALLPKFVALLNEAERTNDFSLVGAGGGWGALRDVGCARVLQPGRLWCGLGYSVAA